MRFSLGNTASTVAAARSTVKNFIKNNLKIYFDFKSKRAKTLEFVGTGSASFDGTNDYITYDDADTKSALQGIKTLTLMGWCRRLSTGGSFINKGAYNTASTDFGMAFQIHGGGTGASDGRWRFSIDETFITWSAPPDDVKTGDGSIYPGPWHHYAVTYNGNASSTSTAANMYIDGELITDTASGSLATIGTNGDDITIGTNINSGADLNGNTKNVGIWNRVLTQEEIQNVMYKSYADLKGSELTHLQFWADLDSDLHAKNNAGATITGTASNEAAIVSSLYGNNVPRKPRGFDNAPTAQADLIGSGSASFTGSNDDYITCGNSSDFKDDPDGEEFTLTAWFKGAAGADGTILSKADKSNRAIQIFTELDDTLKANIGGTSLASATVVADNTWHHVALRSFNDGGTYKGELYVDGIFKVVGTTGSTTATGMDFLIGARRHYDNTDTGYEITGNIAQVGFWGSALTQEQIQSISQKTYDELTTSEKTNLVSWWGLDEETATDGTAGTGGVKDSHGTNHGTLV